MSGLQLVISFGNFVCPLFPLKLPARLSPLAPAFLAMPAIGLRSVGSDCWCGFRGES